MEFRRCALPILLRRANSHNAPKFDSLHLVFIESFEKSRLDHSRLKRRVKNGEVAYLEAVNVVDDMVGIKQTDELTAWINFAPRSLPLGGWRAGDRAADRSTRFW